MEQRLEQVARQGRKERTYLVVSALTSSIIQRMEQVVRQKLNSMLPGLMSRGMEGVERYMVVKLAKELSSSQSRETIGRAVAKGVTIDRW